MASQPGLPGPLGAPRVVTFLEPPSCCQAWEEPRGSPDASLFPFPGTFTTQMERQPRPLPRLGVVGNPAVRLRVSCQMVVNAGGKLRPLGGEKIRKQVLSQVVSIAEENGP